MQAHISTQVYFRLLLLLSTIVHSVHVLGQACCSGGTPLAGSIQFVESDNSKIGASLTYDYNAQKDLVSKSTELSNNPRSRLTYSVLGQVSYSLSRKLSFAALIAWVRQEEVTENIPGTRNVVGTDGLGDAVIFGQYSVYSDVRSVFYLGAGVKAPLGSTDAVNERTRIPLHPDLQVGTGAWDYLFAGQYSRSGVIRPSMQFTSNAIYRITQTGDRFNSQLTYKFGNELRFLNGLSDAIALGTGIFEPSIFVLLRHTEPDLTNDIETPNTGGFWLYFQPNVAYTLSNGLRMNFLIQLPLVRKVTGTQLTTSIRLRAGISYAF